LQQPGQNNESSLQIKEYLTHESMKLPCGKSIEYFNPLSVIRSQLSTISNTTDYIFYPEFEPDVFSAPMKSKRANTIFETFQNEQQITFYDIATILQISEQK